MFSCRWLVSRSGNLSDDRVLIESQEAGGVQLLKLQLSFPVIIVNYLSTRCWEHSGAHPIFLQSGLKWQRVLHPHFMSTVLPPVMFKMSGKTLQRQQTSGLFRVTRFEIVKRRTLWRGRQSGCDYCVNNADST